MAARQVPSDGSDGSLGSAYRRRFDERGSERRHVLVPVRFWVAGDETPLQGALRNLSEEGAFIEAEPLPVKTLVKIELPQRDGVELRRAEVVWLEQSELATHCRYLRGFGVRFLPAP